MINKKKLEVLVADKYSKEVLQEWIEKCHSEALDDMTEWERDFVDSLEAQLQRRGSLSDRQVEILERIYTEKTK